MQHNDVLAGRTKFEEKIKEIGKINPEIETTHGEFGEFINLKLESNNDRTDWKANLSGHEKIEDEAVRTQVLNLFHECFPGQE